MRVATIHLLSSADHIRLSRGEYHDITDDGLVLATSVNTLYSFWESRMLCMLLVIILSNSVSVTSMPIVEYATTVLSTKSVSYTDFPGDNMGLANE